MPSEAAGVRLDDPDKRRAIIACAADFDCDRAAHQGNKSGGRSAAPRRIPGGSAVPLPDARGACPTKKGKVPGIVQGPSKGCRRTCDRSACDHGRHCRGRPPRIGAAACEAGAIPGGAESRRQLRGRRAPFPSRDCPAGRDPCLRRRVRARGRGWRLPASMMPRNAALGHAGRAGQNMRGTPRGAAQGDVHLRHNFRMIWLACWGSPGAAQGDVHLRHNFRAEKAFIADWRDPAHGCWEALPGRRAPGRNTQCRMRGRPNLPGGGGRYRARCGSTARARPVRSVARRLPAPPPSCAAPARPGWRRAASIPAAAARPRHVPAGRVRRPHAAMQP